MGKKEVPQKRPSAPSTKAKSASKNSAAAAITEARRIDQELVKLINRRAAATLKILESEEHPHKTLFSPLFDDTLQELIDKQTGPASPAILRGIFRELIGGTRQQFKPLRVAYLGPVSSFTHIAAIERFGSIAQFLPVSNIASVFEEVNRGHADYGLVPIENSTDGRIVDTLEMFTRLPLKICGEVQLNIHHHLVSKCSRDQIVEIYSKPQALSQCRDWLSRNMPGARLIDVTSTSFAAQLARDKPGVAAVASRQSAIQFELNIVAENIEDNKNNVTRFAVIGDETTKPSGKDKTAILLQIPHKPGSLADALQAFKKTGVNLTWIESFPLKAPETGYLFFLDFEGHIAEQKVKKTVAELESKAVRLEVLGSFPKSDPIG